MVVYSDAARAIRKVAPVQLVSGDKVDTADEPALQDNLAEITEDAVVDETVQPEGASNEHDFEILVAAAAAEMEHVPESVFEEQQLADDGVLHHEDHTEDTAEAAAEPESEHLVDAEYDQAEHQASVFENHVEAEHAVEEAHAVDEDYVADHALEPVSDAVHVEAESVDDGKVEMHVDTENYDVSEHDPEITGDAATAGPDTHDDGNNDGDQQQSQQHDQQAVLQTQEHEHDPVFESGSVEDGTRIDPSQMDQEDAHAGFFPDEAVAVQIPEDVLNNGIENADDIESPEEIAEAMERQLEEM
eukprot:jgi/Hompol1/914/HPOL_004476-RA